MIAQKKLIWRGGLFIFMLGLFAWSGAQGVEAATLSLSPSSGSFTIGSTITANVLLNTSGVGIDGADLRYINYDPTALQVIDENTSLSGTQIAAGTLMGVTLSNSVDTTNGRILFSQVTTAGTTYSNTSNQTLATIRFQALRAATTPVTFTFTSGNTTDTNVSSSGADVLTSVTNGNYTISSAFDFSLANGGNRSTTQGVAVTNSVTATLISGTSVSASFSASGFPTGVTGVFAPTSCTPTCTTTLTITPDLTTVPGNYPITVTATAGSVTRTSTFTLTINAVNVAPVVNAGPDQTITLPATATLNGTATDDGLPSGTLSTTWSVVTGPGTVTFANAAALSTTATFSQSGTYTLQLTANDSALSSSDTIVITVNPVLDTTPPVLSNGLPTGTLPVGTTQATLSLTSNENATCRYATVANTAYASMINTFTTTGVINHQTSVTGLLNGNTYTYYVRCQDTAGNANTSDFVITFNVAAPPPDFSLSLSAPTLTVTRGESGQITTTATLVTGTLSVNFSVTGLSAGTSATFAPTSCTPTCSSTLTISALATAPLGTSTVTISGAGGSVTRTAGLTLLVVSPFATNVSFAPTLEALPALTQLASKNFTIKIFDSVSATQITSFSANPSSTTGLIALPTNTGLREGTYIVRAVANGYLTRKQPVATITSGSTINFSAALFAGDLNNDDVINSLDWSLMNTSWFTADPISDINGDGIVNSVDFSFMNKNWNLAGE